jgi:hypothetical protein
MVPAPPLEPALRPICPHPKPAIKRISKRVTMNRYFPLILLAAAGLAHAGVPPVPSKEQPKPAAPLKPGQNLVPNPNFDDKKDPLAGFRIDFPHEAFYVKNKNYIKVVDNPKGGGKCAQLTMTPGVASNEGAKIETEFFAAVPGASYKVSVDCLPGDYAVKAWAEAWAADPRPNPQPDKYCVPASGTRPALVQCYRAQIPNPPGGAAWQTVEREFTLPAKVTVAGKTTAPTFLTIKVYAYGTGPAEGHSWFKNFHLSQVSAPGEKASPAEKFRLVPKEERPAADTAKKSAKPAVKPGEPKAK